MGQTYILAHPNPFWLDKIIFITLYFYTIKFSIGSVQASKDLTEQRILFTGHCLLTSHYIVFQALLCIQEENIEPVQLLK